MPRKNNAKTAPSRTYYEFHFKDNGRTVFVMYEIASSKEKALKSMKDRLKAANWPVPKHISRELQSEKTYYF